MTDRDKERKAAKAMAVGTAVFTVVFGVFWCVMAASMGAWIMLLFGIPIVGLSLYRSVMTIRHEDRSRDKQPPRYDDPWEQPHSQTAGGDFCPWCGFRLDTEFVFCPKCGRRIQQ